MEVLVEDRAGASPYLLRRIEWVRRIVSMIGPTRSALLDNLIDGVAIGLAIAIFLGPLAGLIIGVIFGLGYVILGLLAGLIIGVIFGLTLVLLIWLAAVVLHYTMRYWLAHTHTFPWQATSFLEDATARILLQLVGRGYSFVHRLLLDYFADTYTEVSSIPPAVQNTRPTPP
jgi:hypothetical protein